ncbi:MAG: hypothetical protein Q7J52_15605, partial [Falsiroseomonas sp.]|nr:hypothetical protein [Falsiroseomonas sp.]
GAAAAREVLAYLRSRADTGNRVARTDVARSAALYRRLSPGLPPAEAERRTAVLLEGAGLAPRPDGLLRSTRWFTRMAAPPAPRPA